MDLDPSILWDFACEVVGTVKPRPRGVPATVTRVDADGTVWVTTGDGTEAPAATCGAGVSVGDVVSVEWSGAQMGVTGNVSDPSAGSRAVGAVQRAVRAARSVADGAQAIANAIGQHFWADDNGAHVSTEADNAIGARNILMNSLGILLRQEGTWLASFSDSAVAFFDGLGNTAANVVAQFGADGAQIGRTGESHQWLDYHSLKLVDKEGNTYFYVSDLRGQDGTAEIVDKFTGDGTKKSFSLTSTATDTSYTVVVSDSSGGTITKLVNQVMFSDAPTDGAVITVTYQSGSTLLKAYTFGRRGAGTVGKFSVSEGYGTTASGAYSHSEGCATSAPAYCSHSEGDHAESSGSISHAEGLQTTASGTASHAEGQVSKASGSTSHAEGYHTTASGHMSHAEGSYTTASGHTSHAEGSNSMASGSYSHAEGVSTASGNWAHSQNRGTIAAQNDQTAIGRFNDNQITSAFEIGNGTDSSNRSNAFTVDWSGNVSASGDVIAAGDVTASNVSASEDVSVAGDLTVSGDATASGNLTAGNFRDAAMTRDLSNSGIVRACRIGSMLVISGSLSGCSVSDTYTWTHLAHIDPAELGITSVGALGAMVDVSGGGPSYYGSTNGGGTARIVDGVLYADMQTNAAFSNRFVKFLITAYVE